MSNQLVCPQCGKSNTCSLNSNCWCHSLPKLLSPSESNECLCSECLIHASAELVNKNKIQLTESQLKDVAALGPAVKPRSGVDYYMEKGLLVMTKWYLLRRGYCCSNDCRHCPYPK